MSERTKVPLICLSLKDAGILDWSFPSLRNPHQVHYQLDLALSVFPWTCPNGSCGSFGGAKLEIESCAWCIADHYSPNCSAHIRAASYFTFRFLCSVLLSWENRANKSFEAIHIRNHIWGYPYKKPYWVRNSKHFPNEFCCRRSSSFWIENLPWSLIY